MSAQYILSKVNAAVELLNDADAELDAYGRYLDNEDDGLIEYVCGICDSPFLGYPCDYICDDCCVDNILAGNVDTGRTPEEDRYEWHPYLADCDCEQCVSAWQNAAGRIEAASVSWDILSSMPLPAQRPVNDHDVCYFCERKLDPPGNICPNCDIPF